MKGCAEQKCTNIVESVQALDIIVFFSLLYFGLHRAFCTATCLRCSSKDITAGANLHSWSALLRQYAALTQSLSHTCPSRHMSEIYPDLTAPCMQSSSHTAPVEPLSQLCSASIIVSSYSDVLLFCAHGHQYFYIGCTSDCLAQTCINTLVQAHQPSTAAEANDPMVNGCR
jgi:hypothetical protein